MKYKGKTTEEIVRDYRRRLRAKQGLLFLVYLLYAVLMLRAIWWQGAGLGTVLLGILILYLVTFLLGIWISWGFLSLNWILNQDCDPVTYTAVCRLLRKVHKRRRNQVNLAVNEAIGIQWCGRFSEAKDMADRLAVPERDGLRQLLVRNLRFNCFVNLEDLESARRVREETARYAGTIRKPALQKRAAELLTLMDCGLALCQRDYGTFRRLEEELSTSYKANIQKVSSAFRLAQADLAQGERENARARLELVVEQGGTLYFVERARETLAAME